MIENLNVHAPGLVRGANPCWVTQTEGRSHTTAEAIEADWASGKEFRVYQYATLVARGHTDRLLKAGFTHLRVVYQREDLSVTAVDVDLSKHKVL